MRRTDERHGMLPFNFVRIFVGAQTTFITADELLHKFDVYRNSDAQTDRRRPRAFRTLCHACSGINFLQQPVHTCPAPIIPGKLSQQAS